MTELPYKTDHLVQQFAHYHSLLSFDKDLRYLIKAVINNEGKCAKYLVMCNFLASVHQQRDM